MSSTDHESLTDIKIWTIEEVAKLFRVHRSTISRYAKSGELKSYVIGNRRLFKENDVWMFFDNRIALECVFDGGNHGNSTHSKT